MSVSTIEYHYQTVGRILAYLINHGLTRHDFDASDVMTIMTERRGDDSEVINTFFNCLFWMRNEGLIHVENVDTYQDGRPPFFGNVQLASKGIAVIKANTNDADIGPSIEKKVTDAKGGDLGSDRYGKIGSFVGGMLGGFTQSFG